MDLGLFLILTSFGLLLNVAGLYAKKAVFYLFAVLMMFAVLGQADLDNAASGGQGFVVGQALNSAGSYVLRYQPLYPMVLVGIFTLLMGVVLMIQNRKHFV